MLNTTEPDKLTYPKRPPYLSIHVSRLSRQFRIAAYPVRLLFAHIKRMEVDEGSDQKSVIYLHWMAAHLRLKNEFTEDEKYHNFMRLPILLRFR